MDQFPFSGAELFDAVPVPATLIDADGIIVDLNASFMQLTREVGYSFTKEERVGRLITDFARGEDLLMIQRVVRKVMATGVAHCADSGWHDREGRKRYADIRARAVVDDRGERIGAIIMREDVTERQHRELERGVLHEVREVIWAMRGEEQIGEALAAIEEGLERMEIPFYGIGVNVVDVEREPPSVRYYMRQEEAEEEWLVDDQQGEEPVIEIWRAGAVTYRKDLSELDQYGESARIGTAFGPGIRSVIDLPFSHGTLAINSREPDAFSEEDIAFFQALAEMLSDCFRRLDDLRALEAKEEQLRQAQKMEAVGQLTAGIAHNFNNLLQGILGNIGLCMADVSAEYRSMMEEAEKAGMRAAEMVQQLMVFARQGIQPQYETVDVAELFEEMVDICRKTFDRKIRIEIEGQKPDAHTKGNSGQLEQVLMNLLLNARDAVLEEGGSQPAIGLLLDEVHVDSARGRRAGTKAGDYIRIRVEDNGPGMDEETKARIFDPFFTTKEVGQGTGLGLSTVYGIVRQHGGWVECASTPGCGATFSVFLPTVVEEEMAAEDPAAEEIAVDGSEKLLVIDDEEVVRTTTSLILGGYGYEVFAAEDGIEGMEMLRREGERIDLVLLDLSMPRMSGEEVLGEIRGLFPQMKVVLFTGYASEERMLEGVVGVVQKPFKGTDLARVIRQALDG